MQGKAVVTALSKYLVSLVMTIIAPLQWLRTLKVAGQHHALDSKARPKILTGIVAGIFLAGVATYVVVDFQDDATQGIYDSLSGRLSISLGNEAFNAAVASQEAALKLIGTADRKIDEAQDAGDAEAEQTWRDNRARFVDQYNEATDKIVGYTPNHELWLAVNQSLLVDRDDAGAKALIEQQQGGVIHADGDTPGFDANGVEHAFETKDEAMADMTQMLNWLVYPGLIGVLWAPVAFATGHVLKTTFVPSESVGFKPYPGGAASLFLLFGAFGVPALFFAAWVMQDFADRTEIGQISL